MSPESGRDKAAPPSDVKRPYSPNPIWATRLCACGLCDFIALFISSKHNNNNNNIATKASTDEDRQLHPAGVMPPCPNALADVASWSLSFSCEA